jgi:hypothetical protein
MYLLKHICIGVNSACNQLIAALILTTSTCLFSYTTSSGNITQLPIHQRAEINAGNGHVNTNLFYCNSNKCKGGVC